MASQTKAFSTLDELDYVETWFRCFTTLTRVKKLKDEKAIRGESKTTDLFLATIGCEAEKKVFVMDFVRELEESIRLL